MKLRLSMLKLILVVLSLLIPLSGYATITLFDYKLSQKYPNTKESMGTYVAGLRDGILLFDVYNTKYKNSKRIFCSDEVFSTEKTIAMLELEIADPTSGKPSYPDDFPLVLILIKAIERFVPCK
jgi:hypothetical protein